MKYIVTNKAMRPASVEQQCFYCNSEIGQEHNEKCILIRKKVKIRAIIEYEIEVPAIWDKEEIEFSRNDGSWCSSNLIGELRELERGICLCGLCDFEYLKDASVPFLSEE